MNAPCQNCKERALNCHSTCDKYLEFRAERLKLSEKRIKDNEFTSYSVSKMLKCKKRKER